MMERALVKAGEHHIKHRMCLIKLQNLSASHSFQAEQNQNAEAQRHPKCHPAFKGRQFAKIICHKLK